MRFVNFFLIYSLAPRFIPQNIFDFRRDFADIFENFDSLTVYLIP